MEKQYKMRPNKMRLDRKWLISPPLSNATPMRLLYMESAFKLPSLTGREVSRVNDLPAFTTKQYEKKREMKLEIRKKKGRKMDG